MPTVKPVSFFKESGLAIPTQCLLLERANDEHVAIADGSQTGLDGLTKCTMEGWFYPVSSIPSTGEVAMNLFSKYDSTSGAAASTRSYEFDIFNLSGQYQAVAQAADSGGNLHQVGWNITAPALNTWAHWAVTWDTTAATAAQPVFILDGSDQGAVTTTYVSNNLTGIRTSSEEFRIGAFRITTYQQQFDGRVADCRFWNIVRTPTEINDSKGARIAPTTSGLVSNWLFDGDLTDTVTGTANDLTENGTISYVSNYPYS